MKNLTTAQFEEALKKFNNENYTEELYKLAKNTVTIIENSKAFEEFILGVIQHVNFDLISIAIRCFGAGFTLGRFIEDKE